MKTTCAIALIAAAILGLQQFTAAKSSSSSNNPQSFLDPLTIQEDTAKDAAQAKHSKPSKHSRSASILQKHQRSNLSDAYGLESTGALSTYQKVPGLRDKTVPKSEEKRQKKLAAKQAKMQKKQKSSLSWNGEAPGQLQGSRHLPTGAQHIKKSHSSLKGNKHTALTGDKKNLFESSADATGKVFTAPVRGFKSLFNKSKSKHPAPDRYY